MKDDEQFVCKECGYTEYDIEHKCLKCGGVMIVKTVEK